MLLLGNDHAAKKVQHFIERLKLSPILHDQASLTAIQSPPEECAKIAPVSYLWPVSALICTSGTLITFTVISDDPQHTLMYSFTHEYRKICLYHMP